jgi:hypothetical protein
LLHVADAEENYAIASLELELVLTDVFEDIAASRQ